MIARRASSRGSRFAARVPWLGKIERYVARKGYIIAKLRINRGGGVAASAFIVLAAVSYGIVTGGHIDPVTTAVRDVRDGVGRAFGFRIATIGFSGNKHLNREEILARAGITGTSSLLFFDVTAARARLMSDPRVADATLLKLYPDRLQISIVERQPFALWQIDRQVSLVAEDGAVLAPYVSKEYLDLPMFVGRVLKSAARNCWRCIDRFPEIRDNLRASILVAERRWNLRLKNGLDVKLPEADVEHALGAARRRSTARRKSCRAISSRSICARRPVAVQLSDAAAAARDAALKEKAKQKKGGSA